MITNYGNILEFILAQLCFISFFWGVFFFFKKNNQGSTSGAKKISLLGGCGIIITELALLFNNNPHVLTTLIGCFLYLLAIALFWWSYKANQKKPLDFAFSLNQPTHLVTYGPYQYVRHPFYTSYMLAWVAGVVATGELWLMAIWIILFPLYFKAAQNEERSFLTSSLKDLYQDYQKNTGAFLPF